MLNEVIFGHNLVTGILIRKEILDTEGRQCRGENSHVFSSSVIKFMAETLTTKSKEIREKHTNLFKVVRFVCASDNRD